MNKKHLSVVMAGAMLASSVAPVLAEVVKEEVSANELGLLQEEVRTLVESARFANEEVNKGFANESIYAVTVNGKEQTQLTADASTKVWQDRFNTLKVGDVVKVYNRGAKEVDGKYYHYDVKKDYVRYKTRNGLESLKAELNLMQGNLIKNAQFSSIEEDTLVLEFNDAEVIPGLDAGESTMIFNKESRKIKEDDSYLPNGKLLIYTDEKHSTENIKALTPATKAEEFYGFVLDNTMESDSKPYPTEVVKEYTITPGGYNFDVRDLYDGLFLTDKGQEFFGLLKDSVASGRQGRICLDDKDNFYGIGNLKASDQEFIKNEEENIKSSLKKYKDVYRFEVRLSAKGELKAETYTISGKDKEEVARLASWMLMPQARVDKFEGSNRYETAAKIAKEYAGLTRSGVNKKYTPVLKGEVNLVLVNGEALVDGLAAAPLAATKANNVNGKSISAPVLLTEADHLPKATKAYLREVLSNIQLSDIPNVTINLVGGETVLSKNLERELKAIGFHGFKVERFGGSNREATSLEVAKEIGFKNNQAFVVGGNGEADAMSIASVAATQKTPIIVGSNNGLSEDAVYALRDVDAMIVGGKTVVTAEDEKELRTEAKSVNRLAGANRKATNAEVIKRYYNTAGFADGVGRAQNVIVAKDGQNNKMELIDALAAANMAAEKKAPIVLATDKLSKEQESVINSYARKAYGLFQVGGGVSRDNVMKKIAKMLELTNRY